MTDVNVTDARAQLPQLLDRVEVGETIHITRHGKRIAVLVGNDVWMKTRTHDVLLQAKELGERLEAAKGQPLPDLPLSPDYDAEGHVAWLRERDEDDPWKDDR